MVLASIADGSFMSSSSSSPPWRSETTRRRQPSLSRRRIELRRRRYALDPARRRSHTPMAGFHSFAHLVLLLLAMYDPAPKLFDLQKGPLESTLNFWLSILDPQNCTMVPCFLIVLNLAINFVNCKDNLAISSQTSQVCTLAPIYAIMHVNAILRPKCNLEWLKWAKWDAKYH